LNIGKTSWGRTEQGVEATDKLWGTATYISLEHEDVKTRTNVNLAGADRRVTKQD
jgi:hypothetical protein